MIYLYVKTHNITGLKYLGKTIQDPFKYKGSGKYWTRHIKKYGNNVTTEIIFQTEDKELFRKKAIFYSEYFCIVENKNWAKISREEGQGGNTNNYDKHRGKGSRPNAKGKTGPKGKKQTPEHSEKIGKSVSEYWKNNKRIAWNKGIPMSEGQKQKLKEAAIRLRTC